MDKIQLTFLPHGAGCCGECGKQQDVLFFTTLSDSTETQSMAICRDCAARIQARVDKYNAAQQRKEQAAAAQAGQTPLRRTQQVPPRQTKQMPPASQPP